MADGITGVVHLSPEAGDKVRGAAAGLGSVNDLEDITRPELMQARRTGDVALVHSWELVTSVDGPGTRMTMFMSGCPLRCQYCHNPDTMEMKVGTLERIEDVVKRMKKGAVLVDVAIDQGGCFENSHKTSHDEPTFQVHDTLFYCVANMPGAVANTSARALGSATLPYMRALAAGGFDGAAARFPGLANGLMTRDGQLVSQPVKDAFGL